jgi:hypothetical protein
MPKLLRYLGLAFCLMLILAVPATAQAEDEWTPPVGYHYSSNECRFDDTVVVSFNVTEYRHVPTGVMYDGGEMTFILVHNDDFALANEFDSYSEWVTTMEVASVHHETTANGSWSVRIAQPGNYLLLRANKNNTCIMYYSFEWHVVPSGQMPLNDVLFFAAGAVGVLVVMIGLYTCVWRKPR